MRIQPLIAGIVLAGVLSISARADISLEYAVKAAYLPKFIPFIAWPDASFASTTASVSICVLGNDPFGGKLEQSAAITKAGERSILVRHMEALDPEVPCHVIFLPSDSDPGLVQSTMDATKGKPVVTVTDSGLNVHGIISFVILANHVRFDIDDASAARSGLTISSKLLGLANSVKQRGQP